MGRRGGGERQTNVDALEDLPAFARRLRRGRRLHELLSCACSLGFGAGKEVFIGAFAGIAGQLAGPGTNSDFLEIFRRGESTNRLVFEKPGHDFIPDGGSTGDTGSDITHGRIVIVADPDGS